MRITNMANSGEYVLGDMRLTEENLGTVEPFKSIRKRTIVTLGDSIFGMVTGDTGVSNLIAAGLGCTVINGAFGGTRAIARTEDSGYNDFDFTALVDAIIANDYSAQEAALTDHSMSSTIAPQLASLKTADFSKADIVTLNYGTNDYTGYHEVESFISGYEEAIGKLMAAYPQLDVVLITPTYRMMYADDRIFCDDYNGPQEIDHLFPMNREHGKINQRKREESILCHEGNTHRNLRPRSFWRYSRESGSWEPLLRRTT